MRRSARRGLLLLVGVWLILSRGVHGSWDDKDDAARVLPKLERGMTTQEVRNRLGPPKRFSRQILYHRYLEQWIYDVPVPARLTFDCPRGQKPQLLWHKTLPAEDDNARLRKDR